MLKGTRKQIETMEQRIEELEVELIDELSGEKEPNYEYALEVYTRISLLQGIVKECKYGNEYF